MFSKVLIANRGEIAIRIARACRDLGLATVAVYSEADQDALHVAAADQAVCIGPPPAGASYLNLAAIIDAAKATGADALHPGYGFLSENPALAEACAAADIVFIGPPAKAIRAMADKAAAKRFAERIGVPVLTGYHGRAQTDSRLTQEAARIGYPLLVKAAAGGGGRGMRVAEGPDALADALAAARREATSAFGDGRLLLERYLEGPRHIEVQVLADHQGHVITLGERECSLQRRHQKVIEEAPAPRLARATRAGLETAAVKLAQAINYVNAGTVEFLVDATGGFYFLEMNTRLQVEHPVTELVTGVDLVQQQLRIAQGEPLAIVQKDVRLRGHAIECRVYAEDPAQGFAPAPGTLALFEPPTGAGLRNDVGFATGRSVSQYYDAMLGKLIVYGDTRAEAVERTRQALEQYAVLGVSTNLPLLRWIAGDMALATGRLTTQLLEQRLLPDFLAKAPAQPVEQAAAVAAALEAATAAGGAQVNPWLAAGPWQPGRGRVMRYGWQGASYEAAVGAVADAGEGTTAGTAEVTVGSERFQIACRALAERRFAVTLDGAQTLVWLAPVPGGVALWWKGEAYHFRKIGPASFDNVAQAQHRGQHRGLTAPMPATVLRILVQPGDSVRARQTLIVLEAMKMEHLIQATAAGVVQQVHCAVGSTVAEGAVLIEVGEA